MGNAKEAGGGGGRLVYAECLTKRRKTNGTRNKRETRDTRDTSGTRCTRGKRDTRGTCGTTDARGARDTRATPDTRKKIF